MVTGASDAGGGRLEGQPLSQATGTTSAPASPRPFAGRNEPDTSNGISTGSKASQVAYLGTVSETMTAGEASSLPRRVFPSDASLVLVGIRGCGKRSLGFIAATALGRRFITEDHYFQKVTGLTRQDYLKQHGNQDFHQAEVKVSMRMLDENKTGCVIECGLGSLTSSVQEHLKRYTLSNPVIYLVRSMTEIKRLLKLDDRAARMLENADPTHRRCSNFEYYNLEEAAKQEEMEENYSDRVSPTYSFRLKESQEDFSYFVRFITGVATRRHEEESPFSLSETPVERRLFTHAIQVRLSALSEAKFDLSQLESAGDLVEITIDRWDRTTAKVLSKAVADVRRQIALPIIVGTAVEHLKMSHETHLGILEHALRLGVEFLSVDLRLEDHFVKTLVLSKGFTKIVGTFIETVSSQLGWEDPEWIKRYRTAQLLGCDVVRLVRHASSRDDNDALVTFSLKMRESGLSHLPLIAFNTGPLGRTSQVFNKVLTSVTHPVLHGLAGSEKLNGNIQLSSQQAVQALFKSFVLDPLTFYIVGANVSKSLSPSMHNTAYRLLGMHHEYKTHDINSLADFEKLAEDHTFGGASIVQPWKVQLVDQLASLSSHARSIGAVNTIIPLRAQADGTVPSLNIQASQRNRAGAVAAWFGDNTDWIGIRVCMNRSLSPRNVVKSSKTTALVVGAGGMARAAIYAMLQLGCRNIFVFNRTLANAESLAKHFNAGAGRWHAPSEPADILRVLRSKEDPWPPGFEMPTMIVSCVTQETIYGREPANFTMPLSWLGSESGGVVMEMSYATRNTPLASQIRSVRKESGIPWVFVDGLETLPEQAIAQFELWTGRKAPRKCIREAIVKTALERESHPD